MPLVRTIIRLSDDGEPLSARRSPRRGRIEDIFDRLVSIPSLLCNPRFELEVILTHQEELRVYRHGQAFRRHGWVVAGRRLVSVEQRVRSARPVDAARLLPPGLPELFDTGQLAEAAAIERAALPNRWRIACEQSASSRRQGNVATPSSTAASRYRGIPEGVDVKHPVPGRRPGGFSADELRALEGSRRRRRPRPGRLRACHKRLRRALTRFAACRS